MAKSYQEYQRDIAELQKKADIARRAELAGAIGQIKALMTQYGISIADLGSLKQGKRKSAGRPVAAKYRDPVSGATWSGRGRAPGWVSKAKAEGKLDSLLLIKADKKDKVSADKVPATLGAKGKPKKASSKAPAERVRKAPAAAKKKPASNRNVKAVQPEVPATEPSASAA